MPVPTFSGLPPFPGFEDVVQKINKLVNELRNLMLNLDDANFDKITANVLDVNELSAITANMGKLTSGEIYGAYIATREGAYPRVEMSNTEDLFGAYASPDKFLLIEAFNGISDSPALVFSDQTVPVTAIMFIDDTSEDFNIVSPNTIQISASPGGDVRIYGNKVRFDSWSNIYSDTPVQSLQAALNAKANSFIGFTGTVYVSSTPGGPANVAKNFSNGVCTS